jgi:membrane-associated protease RseP (regulator of RpoE activity)
LTKENIVHVSMKWLLGVLVASAVGVQAADAPPPDLETRLEVARQKLDAAAKEFADLHRELGAGMGIGPEAGMVSVQNFAFARKGMLGIVLGPPLGDGVEVIGVTPGSGAEAAGLQAGDVVLAVGGAPVAGPARNLHHALASPEPGDVVAVDFQRGDDRQSVEVTVSEPRPFQTRVPAPGEMSAGVMTASVAAAPAFFHGQMHALQLHDVDANLGRYFGVSSGVLVMQAEADTGLEAGDILLRVADVDIRNASDAFGRMVGAQGSVAVTVLRDGAERTVDFVPGLVGAPADRVFRIEGVTTPPVQVFRNE